VSWDGVGATSIVTHFAKDRHSEVNTKRSYIAFSVTYIDLSLVHFNLRLLGVGCPALSLIKSTGVLYMWCMIEKQRNEAQCPCGVENSRYLWYSLLNAERYVYFLKSESLI